ncbi:hypothetical protein [Embleya sp. NPDC020886]|uniref:hypothetical protein n=1 Tax=Embleya sp. NPDC020886 TaxID=3363980 RepID=UPI0037BDB190
MGLPGRVGVGETTQYDRDVLGQPGIADHTTSAQPANAECAPDSRARRGYAAISFAIAAPAAAS